MTEATNDDQAEAATDNNADQESRQTFTFKAVLFGLVALALIILSDDFNNFYLKQRSLNAGFLPPGPLLLILLAAVAWNPIWNNRTCFLLVAPLFIGLGTLWTALLFPWTWFLLIPAGAALLYLSLLHRPLWLRAGKQLRLSARELIIAIIIVFCGSWTGGAGLAEFHAYTHIIPWVKYENRLQDHKYQTLEYVPEHLWPAGGLHRLKEEGNTAERKRVYNAFMTGYEEQETDGVPLDAWLSPLLHWLPFIICLSLCFMGMSLIVHRQWSTYEQLSYPLSKLTVSIFSRHQQRSLPDIFYLPLFWVGFGITAFIYSLNMLHAWWPGNFPEISTKTNFNFLYDQFPTLMKSGAHHVTRFNFLFSAVGICYFLSREIGLSLGISKILLALLGAQVYLVSGVTIGHEELSNATAGAYIAYAAIILFTGRHYYKSVIVKACKPSSCDDEDSNGIWGARLLLVSFIGLTLSLTWSFGLDFPTALLFGLLTLLAFLVFTRIICETGIPYLQILWNPAMILTKMLGLATVGAGPIVILHFINTAVLMDAKNAMMPFVSNSLKLAEDFRIKIKKLCLLLIVIIIAAILFSLITRLYQHYTFGANVVGDGYAKSWVQNRFLQVSADQLGDLEDVKLRHPPGQPQDTFFQRLGYLEPSSTTLFHMLMGAIGVAAFFLLRTRFTGFPLHPVLFLVWATWPVGMTFYSFLIGWVVRELIIKYGGDHVYQKCKPFFIGLIIGELSLFFLSSLCGMNYNLFTGELPPRI